MSQQIETFTSTEFGSIRALRDENGEPWLVATDLAKVLEYQSAAQFTRLLDADEKGMQILHTPGGDQKMSIINESGFYRAIMQRRSSWVKDEHKRQFIVSFQRWVTHEVLPSIRKTGMYATPDTVERILDNPDVMIGILQRYKDAKEENARQAAQLEAQKPKVLFADAVGASDGTCLVGELAKMLTQAGYTVGQNRLFRQLRDDGFLGKVGQNRNVPLQRWLEQGLFRIKETAITHPDGHVTLNRTTKVTGKGQRYLIDYYTKGKAEADATVD